MPTTQPEKLLNPTETAAILGIAVGTLSVWRCTRRYDLPYVKSGRRVKYRPSDIEAFITSRTVGSVNPA